MEAFKSSPAASREGFSLLEVLVAMAVFAIVLIAVFGIIDQTRGAWKSARQSSESFQGARMAFDQITRTLSRATLNTYYDYFDSAGRNPQEPLYDRPSRYGRQSDLHFVSGKSLVPSQVGHAVFFQAPLGLTQSANLEGRESLLNACGYFVVHGTDATRPAFLDPGAYESIPNPRRYRLMQFFQPSENLGVYDGTDDFSWFQQPLSGEAPPIEQLAENVVVFVVLPRKSAFETADGAASLTTDYEYDTRQDALSSTQQPAQNQLPPVVEVLMVAIDRDSASRLGDSPLNLPAGLFEDPLRLDPDLKTLERTLVSRNLRYRVFRASVAIRGAKWSA